MEEKKENIAIEKIKEKFKKIKLKKINVISIIICIIICIIGIVFIYLSINKSQIYVEEGKGIKTFGVGYATKYGADFYTEASENMVFIANAIEETYYLIERCFGILLIIISVFYLLHTLKQINAETNP